MGISKEHLGGCVSCVTPEKRHGGGFAMYTVTQEESKLFFGFLVVGTSE